MERIRGVDVARGLAVLGMMSAHVGVIGPDLWSTDGWLGIVDGRSSALFAVLAGLSIALLSGGPVAPDGAAVRRVRVRVLVRGAVLLLLGTVLTALGTPIAVILPSYGVLFALALPALRLPPAVLVTLAAAVAVGGPAICFPLVAALTAAGDPPTGLLELLIAGYYPAVIWMAYVLAGLAVGRSDLRSGRLRGRLLATGVALAVVGYGGGVLGTALAAGQPAGVLAFLSVEPHADSTVEVTGNIGVALVVLVVCLWVADRWPRTVAPIAATGALALTAYCTHIVVIAVLGPQVVREPRVGVHVAFLVVTVLLATLWRRLLGRGPLERGLHEVSTRVAAMVTDGPPSGPGGGPHPGPVGGVAPPRPAGAPAPDQGQTSSRVQPSGERR
ncbi:DUF418 domain-containing protein [uncultured Cellulomonas sp.]|uniref:DUF418 domain-containing protein n=1 Tax=uncultured Cellulomonas sp. TaxID=189682 RepID=UPI002634D309|nr:DUF418 domain-containing protein [uncultured Cellulomonas sp.]